MGSARHGSRMETRRPTAHGSATARSTDHPSEDVLVRNYDFQWGYDLELAVQRPGFDAALEARYYLPPGGTHSEFDALEPGEYRVRAVLDNRRTVEARVTVEPGPGGGLLVELGNGAISVHAGLYA